MAEIRFRRWETLGDDDPKACFVEDFVDGAALMSWAVIKGERMGAEIPDPARIYLPSGHKGIQLRDFIGNNLSMLLVSTPLKEAVERHCSGVDVEYVPVTIHDHRRRAHGKGYWIVNPIGTFDCLDTNKSDILWDEEDPKKILDVEEHVLDRRKVKDAPQLFRVRGDSGTYVIGRKLAREIYDRDFTNILWAELAFGDEV